MNGNKIVFQLFMLLFSKYGSIVWNNTQFIKVDAIFKMQFVYYFPESIRQLLFN